MLGETEAGVSVEHYPGNGELWWTLEHEEDPYPSLRKKYLRCGSREGRSRICTHEYAYLSAHTHIYASKHTCARGKDHICIASHIPPRRHAAVHVSTNNPFTRPCKQTPSVYAQVPDVHIGTLRSHRVCTLKHRSTEQRPKAHRGKDTGTVSTKLPPRESSQKSMPASHPAASLLPGFTGWPHRLWPHRPSPQCPHTLYTHVSPCARAHTQTAAGSLALTPSRGWPMSARRALSPRRPAELPIGWERPMGAWPREPTPPHYPCAPLGLRPYRKV